VVRGPVRQREEEGNVASNCATRHPHSRPTFLHGNGYSFGALVSTAVMQRRRPEAHKRLTLLATISLLTAAIGRGLRQLGMGGAPNLFLGTDVFVLVLVLYDLGSRGRLHTTTLWGGALVVGFKLLLYYALSGTPAWLALADALRI